LLTNVCGRLARALELGRRPVWACGAIRVRAHGSVAQRSSAMRFATRSPSTGVLYGNEATVDRLQAAVWLTFAIREGKTAS